MPNNLDNTQKMITFAVSNLINKRYGVHRKRGWANTSHQELQKGLSERAEKFRNLHHGFGLRVNGTRVTNQPPLRGGAQKERNMAQVATIQQRATVRQVLADVYEEVNWAYLAKNYFGKSRSWLYHKFSGRNNGVEDDFNDVDRERLKSALNDIAMRLMATANRLWLSLIKFDPAPVS